MATFQLFCSSGLPRKRDSVWSWLVCSCATINYILSLGFVFSFGVCLPVFMDYFNASRKTTACVGSVGIALTFFAGNVSTALVTRFGCRITTIIGGAFCGLSLLASSFAESILVLFFSYSIPFGFGCSCIFSSGMVVANQYFNKRKSIGMGVLQMGIGAGVLVMGPALEATITATGWRTTYRIMAGVVFAVCLLAIPFDPNVEKDDETTSQQAANQERKHESTISKIKMVFDLSIWKEPPFIALVLPYAILSFGHFVPLIHLIRYCEELGISAEKASKLLIYEGLCSAFGRLLAGILCSHPKVETFRVLQAAEFTAGLSVILMTAAPTFTTLTVCTVFYGLGDGFFFTSLSCLTFTVSPLKSAAVLGWGMTVTSLFLASGPALAGLLADKLGSYVLPFRLAGSITLSGTFIPFMLLCYKRPYRGSLVQRDEEHEKLLKCSSAQIGAC